MALVDPTRIRHLNSQTYRSGPVYYWMFRDQRLRHNWALLYAQQKALEYKTSLVIIVILRPDLVAHRMLPRTINFMFEGLRILENDLRNYHIPLKVLIGEPVQVAGLQTKKAGLIVCDFSPLRTPLGWHQDLAQSVDIPVVQVDAHNIIPAWVTSDKQEYAARTIRPKIHRKLTSYLIPYPSLVKHPIDHTPIKQVNWPRIRRSFGLSLTSNSLSVKPGETGANSQVKYFLKQGRGYHLLRNDPNANVISGLSPYLHFGHISAYTVATEIQSSGLPSTDQEAFLEELIIRRELADNYCLYNHNYDSFNGFPSWAQKTLNHHRLDKRDYIYTKDQFDSASTHDDLWNAVQIQLVKSGKIHGYLRMYWAKKILEWSKSPKLAQAIAIDLNDRYSLDGRDPSGYTGIAWSIGGVHDRPWFERKVFGKIRYMNRAGADRKFDTKKYIETWIS
jgi:deoxyribodipyrimidine photo-lyase